MVRHRSAEKRVRQALKKRMRTKVYQGNVRSKIKKVLQLIEAGKTEEARVAGRLAESAIARAVSKGVINKRKCSRLTSRLMAKVNRAAAVTPPQS